jgi:uncharacterized RDD family membrane protein YckC
MQNETTRAASEGDISHGVMDAFAPPQANVEPKVDVSLAGPWRRWLARQLDLCWQMGGFAFAVGGGLALMAPELFVTMMKPGFEQLFSIVMLLFALITDALTHRMFGNSLGKALLGVRVVSREGQMLSFGEHLGRNLRAWVSGLGLGIPLIMLITMARQHGRVKAGKRASYDERRGTRVLGAPIGAARVAAAIVVYLAFMTVIVWLYTLEE